MTFLLRLNDMRSPQCEILTDVAVGETVETLQRWLDSHRAPEPYTDASDDPNAGQVVCDDFASSGVRSHPRSWHKVFTKGSPLEWYNPPTGPDNVLRVPSREDMRRMADQTYDELEQRLAPLTRVP